MRVGTDSEKNGGVSNCACRKEENGRGDISITRNVHRVVGIVTGRAVVRDTRVLSFLSVGVGHGLLRLIVLWGFGRQVS